jgi:hypothetical protein
MMREPRMGRRLALWMCGAALMVAVVAHPVAGRVMGRIAGKIVTRIATSLVAPAEAGQTLRFRPVPRESETVVARRVARTKVRVDTTETVDESEAVTPAEPEPPEPPKGLIVTRSGDVMRVGSDIHIKADEVVKGDVTALKGDVTVDGHVEGNVVAMFGDVYLNPSARVDGDVVCMRGELHEQPGAVVSGQRVTALSSEGRERLRELERERHRHGRVAGMIVCLIIFTGVAWGASLLTPGRLVSSLDTLRRQPMLSFGISMLVVALMVPSVIALAIVVALLCITVIGIPLAMAALLAYGLFYVAMGGFGWATGAALVGQWISARRGESHPDVRRWALFGSLTVMGGILIGAVLASSGTALGGLGVFMLVIGWISFGFLSWFGAGAWLRSEFTSGLLGRWWAARRRRSVPAPGMPGAGTTMPGAGTGAAPPPPPPAPPPPAAPEPPPPPPPPPPSPPEAYRPPEPEPPVTG